MSKRKKAKTGKDTSYDVCQITEEHCDHPDQCVSCPVFEDWAIGDEW